jgi:hypothetical protein
LVSLGRELTEPPSEQDPGVSSDRLAHELVESLDSACRVNES